MKNQAAALFASMIGGTSLRNMPRLKIKARPGKDKHHSDRELARRRGQLQHRNQVVFDLVNKRQPG